MKAPCCLLGAGALPRPPEPSRGPRLSPGSSGMPRGSYIYLWCVWWVIVVAAAAEAHTDCAVRTDARDVASKAYVSPQVVEAVVREVDSFALPGRPYTVNVQVTKKLRAYGGRPRVKKSDNVTLTFRLPLAYPASDPGAGDSDRDACLVTAALKVRRKYLLFLSDGGGRSAALHPVAPPDLASKKLRRLVRKTVCKNCGQAPRVSGLGDDSVVQNYNLSLECSVEGNPLPEVLWLKDDLPLHSSRKFRIRTRVRKLRRRKLRYGRDVQSPRVESRRQRLLRKKLRARRAEVARRRELVRETRLEGAAGERRRLQGAGETRRRRLERTRGGRLAREEARERRKTRAEEAKGKRRRLDRAGRGQERVEPTGRNRKLGRAQTAGGKSRRRLGRRGRRQGTREYKRRTTTQPDGTSRRRHNDARTSIITSTTPASTIGTSGPGGSRKRRRRPIPQRRVLVSHLVVRSVVEDDAGIYKCVAKSVVGEAEALATIRVVPPIDPHPFVDKCPYDGYCLNGGTCMMFKIVGELVCQCAEGFKGQRCTEKEVYPTFNRNCHGPMRNLRHSQGRRCPRNQPAALWELLQQTLARRHKVSPWTKTQMLSWSPSHTGNAFWLQHLRPAPHSPPPPLPNPQNLTASGQDTTLNPTLMDSLFPSHDLSQVTRRRGPLRRQTSWPTSPLDQPHPSQLPYPDPSQPTSLNSLVQRTGAGSDNAKDPTFNTSVLTHPLNPPSHRVGESPDPRHHNSKHHHHTSKIRHRHHHRHHSRGPPQYSTTSEGITATTTHLSQPVQPVNGQQIVQTQTWWSSEVEPSTPTPQPHSAPSHQ